MLLFEDFDLLAQQDASFLSSLTTLLEQSRVWADAESALLALLCCMAMSCQAQLPLELSHIHL